MDFNALQHKLFALDPRDPAEDKRALLAQAGQPTEGPAIDEPIVESYNAPEGSLKIDRNYSVDDFAALAGVTTPTPSVAQPIIEATPDPVIVQDKDTRIAQLEERVAKLEALLTEKQDPPRKKESMSVKEELEQRLKEFQKRK